MLLLLLLLLLILNLIIQDFIQFCIYLFELNFFILLKICTFTSLTWRIKIFHTMKKELNLAVAAHIAYDEQLLKQEVAEQLSLKSTDTFFIKPLRRSIDARSRNIKVNLKLAVWINEPVADDDLGINYTDVSSAQKSITIIGAGPAGLYAALRCLEIGIKPILFERGKDVQARRRDLAVNTVVCISSYMTLFKVSKAASILTNGTMR